MVTAAFMNAHVRDNETVLRAGGLALASQAALDLIFAVSTTQLGRLAVGSALQVLRVNAGASAYEFTSPVKPADEFVSYTTAAAAVSATVSGLDLNTDLSYEFIVQTTVAGSSQKFQAQINAAAPGTDTVSSQTVNQAGTPTQYGTTAANFWELGGNIVGLLFFCIGRLFIGTSGHPVFDFKTVSEDTGALVSISGACFRGTTTNVTSVKFQLDGSTCDWKIWCRRTRQA